MLTRYVRLECACYRALRSLKIGCSREVRRALVENIGRTELNYSFRLVNYGPEKGQFVSIKYLTLIPYFFFGLFFGALGFAEQFGRGAFGFFVGTLVTFLALDGDFLVLDGEARFFSGVFAAAFFGALAFFTLAALCFFTFGPDVARPRAGAVGATTVSVFAAASLNDPEAPLHLVWNNSPEATAVFKYFFMNGDNFSESTL